MHALLLASVAFAHPLDDCDTPVQTTAEVRQPPRDHGLSVGFELGMKPATYGSAESMVLPTALVLGGELEWRPAPLVGIAVSGAFTPALDTLWDDGWRPITKQIINQNQVTPNVVRAQGRAAAMVVLSPIRATLVRPAPTTVMLDVGAGFGAIHTVDDLEALQAENDASAIATAVQWHPTLTWLAGPRIDLGRGWSSTLRARGTHWIETLEGLSLEKAAFVDFGLGLRRTF